MVDVKDLLHATFPKISKEDWLKQLEKDLKGTSIQDALEINDPVEEITFKSHFHWSESQADKTTGFNSVRSFKSTNDWIIYQQIASTDVKHSNKLALENLMMGCNGIGFSENSDLIARVNELQLEYIYTDFAVNSVAEVQEVLKVLPDKKDVTLVYDPLTNGKSEDVIRIFSMVKDIENLKAFEINNAVYAAAGANCTQQLGIACSQVKAYMELLTENGENANLVVDKLQLNVGIGANYLVEIAKFRALRLLIDNILEAYGVDAGKQIRIKAQSLFVNKSLEDPYTNLLRLTTEGMSATIGGIDILHLHPYDGWSSNGASLFAYRMSNNISNILKEESFLDKVVDAAGGTYAIEKATEILAESAWDFFQKIEKKGGFTTSTSFIQTEIARIAQTRIKLIQQKKMKLIGINIYPNPDKTQLKWHTPSSSIIQPLILEQHKEGGEV